MSNINDMPTLEGEAYATTRAEIVRIAKSRAATYYGTHCVRVRIGKESFDPADPEVVGARFEATIWHRITTNSYGMCEACKKYASNTASEWEPA